VEEMYQLYIRTLRKSGCSQLPPYHCSTRLTKFSQPADTGNVLLRNARTNTAHYLFGCRLPLRWLSHRSGNRQPKIYVKPEAAITDFELLMMGGVAQNMLSN